MKLRTRPRMCSPRTVVWILALWLLVAVLGLVGCGGGSPATSGPASSTAGSASVPGADVTVVMKNIKYAPTQVTIKVGQTVGWVNEDGTQHDVVANGGAFKSALLDKGQTFTFKFTTAGTFPYYCSIHPQMTATVTVQP